MSLPCGKRHELTYARSAHQCSTFQKLMFLQLLHFKERLFSAAKIARLKNTSSLLTANSMMNVCAFCASMQQFPKLIFCSTVAFIGRYNFGNHHQGPYIPVQSLMANFGEAKISLLSNPPPSMAVSLTGEKLCFWRVKMNEY